MHCRDKIFCEFSIAYSNWAMGFRLDMAPLCFNATGNYFAGRFLDSARNDMGDMATLGFLPTGNCLRRVSYSTWHYCVSLRQETICEGFPVRHGTTVFLADRKLFRERFPIRLDAIVFQCDRKLFSGRFLDSVSLTSWYFRFHNGAIIRSK